MNEQVINDSGYSIEKLSVGTTSVKIEGSRKVIAKFDSDNIMATLDFSDVNMSKLSPDNIITVNLKVESEFGDVVSFTPSAVDVYIEPTKYKELDVNYMTTGQLYDDYIIDDVVLSQDKVRISGASNKLENVECAKVMLNLINIKYESYVSGKFSEDCDVFLYNAYDKQLSDKEGRWVWNSTPEMTVSGSLYKVKEVEVVPNISGIGENENYTSDIKTIKVYGNNSKIEKIDKINTVLIEKSELEKNPDTAVKLDLPDWMRVVDNISEVKINANSD